MLFFSFQNQPTDQSWKTDYGDTIKRKGISLGKKKIDGGLLWERVRAKLPYHCLLQQGFERHSLCWWNKEWRLSWQFEGSDVTSGGTENGAIAETGGRAGTWWERRGG